MMYVCWPDVRAARPGTLVGEMDMGTMNELPLAIGAHIRFRITGGQYAGEHVGTIRRRLMSGRTQSSPTGRAQYEVATVVGHGRVSETRTMVIDAEAVLGVTDPNRAARAAELRTLRGGATQAAFAAELGIDPNTLIRQERAESEIGESVLVQARAIAARIKREQA